MESNKRVLLGTVGYHLLSNHSIGPLLIDQIKEKAWAKDIIVEEMNWGPVAIVQQFQSMDIPYDRVVFLTAIEREEREIGDVHIYRWGGRIPDERAVQACIGDAVTGVISVENLLIIGEYFGIWPEEVFLVDVEPGPEKAGIELSPEVQERIWEYFGILENVCNIGTVTGYDIQVLYGDQIPIH